MYRYKRRAAGTALQLFLQVELLRQTGGALIGRVGLNERAAQAARNLHGSKQGGRMMLMLLLLARRHDAINE